MKILLHICCAPCTIYPLGIIREWGHSVKGFFFNPNIHPYLEYARRLESLLNYAGIVKLELETAEEYSLEEYFRSVLLDVKNRCRICYKLRLESAALQAFRQGYEAFSSTLLYSKFQKHELIKELGDEVAEKIGIEFFYHDFREGWKEGVKISRELNIYRQQYCGCVFSERERFFKKKKLS